MNKKLFGVAAAALATAASVGAVQQAAAQSAPAPAPTVNTRWSGAPRTEEEDRRFKVNGRVHYDMYNVDADFTANNGTNPDVSYSGAYVRRAFIGVEGQFTNEWRYNMKFDLAAGAANTGEEVKLDDFFLEYAGDNFSVFLGQNNAISHMEDRTSSNYTPFNERSSIDQAFGFGKIMGVGVLFGGGNWSLGTEFYGQSLNDPEVYGEDERAALYVRGTWAPIYQRTPDGITLVHLGFNVRQRDNGGGNPFNNTVVTDGSLPAYGPRVPINSLSTFPALIGTSGSYDKDLLLGGEFAAQWNAFGMTAEYMEVTATPENGALSDRDFTGGYVDFFWSPTGESRNYSASDGSWGRVTPRATMGSDGIGHIMLSLRYDWIDLADGAEGEAGSELGAGEQSGYVAGVTWQPIAYVKFQLNYSDYEVDRRTSAAATPAGRAPLIGRDGDVQVVTLRTQVDW
jgi:phosphate-selective porin OprO/OprP